MLSLKKIRIDKYQPAHSELGAIGFKQAFNIDPPTAEIHFYSIEISLSNFNDDIIELDIIRTSNDGALICRRGLALFGLLVISFSSSGIAQGQNSFRTVVRYSCIGATPQN